MLLIPTTHVLNIRFLDDALTIGKLSKKCAEERSKNLAKRNV